MGTNHGQWWNTRISVLSKNPLALTDIIVRTPTSFILFGASDGHLTFAWLSCLPTDHADVTQSHPTTCFWAWGYHPRVKWTQGFYVALHDVWMQPSFCKSKMNRDFQLIVACWSFTEANPRIVQIYKADLNLAPVEYLTCSEVPKEFYKIASNMKLAISSLVSLLLALWAFAPETQASTQDIRVCQNIDGGEPYQVLTTSRRPFVSHHCLHVATE